MAKAVRITETELMLPSLYLMSLANGKITTAELIKKLRIVMKPSGEDLKILSGRTDDKFSQKVRNLKAHDTFERFGYAEYKGTSGSGHFEITQLGKTHLQNNWDVLRYLLVNDFKYEDIKNSLDTIEQNKKKRVQIFDEDVIIQEGVKALAETQVYTRSRTLREYAIGYFSNTKGKIGCHCCQFDFHDFYGAIGKNFIEIHHTKPIFKYEDDDLSKTIKDALKNLTPVCSNCHRMIHRNWTKPLEVQQLIDSVNANGAFSRFNK